jgi:hypothetical protein
MRAATKKIRTILQQEQLVGKVVGPELQGLQHSNAHNHSSSSTTAQQQQ